MFDKDIKRILFNKYNWNEKDIRRIEVLFNETNTCTDCANYRPTSANIYGIAVINNKVTRTDDAQYFDDPKPYYKGCDSYGSPFDNLMPWAGMKIVERPAGIMVSIPKFWYQLTDDDGCFRIKIADAPTPGFYVSPAHIDRGDGRGEKDVVYIGRYHCGSNYKSETDKMPVTNITLGEARHFIGSLGENIAQADFLMRFTIWLLYMVEFTNWDSQSAIGKGCSVNGEIMRMGYTDSMPYHTGSITAKGKYGGTQYRNIEGLWDNVLDWMDGCYNNYNGLNIIVNPQNFESHKDSFCLGVPQSGTIDSFKVVNKGFPLFIPN